MGILPLLAAIPVLAPLTLQREARQLPLPSPPPAHSPTPASPCSQPEASSASPKGGRSPGPSGVGGPKLRWGCAHKGLGASPLSFSPPRFLRLPVCCVVLCSARLTGRSSHCQAPGPGSTQGAVTPAAAKAITWSLSLHPCGLNEALCFRGASTGLPVLLSQSDSTWRPSAARPLLSGGECSACKFPVSSERSTAIPTLSWPTRSVSHDSPSGSQQHTVSAEGTGRSDPAHHLLTRPPGQPAGHCALPLCPVLRCRQKPGRALGQVRFP